MLSLLTLSVSLSTESSFSFGNNFTFSLLSLLTLMYKLFLCTCQISSPDELQLSWHIPTHPGNVFEFFLCTVFSSTFCLFTLHLTRYEQTLSGVGRDTNQSDKVNFNKVLHVCSIKGILKIMLVVCLLVFLNNQLPYE